MAAGLTVVCWSAGNLPHLARHGGEGRVVGAAAARRAEDFPTRDETARMLFTELRAVLA
jgi:hypothetical protein